MQVPQSALVTVGRQRLIRELVSTANAACVGLSGAEPCRAKSHDYSFHDHGTDTFHSRLLILFTSCVLVSTNICARRGYRLSKQLFSSVVYDGRPQIHPLNIDHFATSFTDSSCSMIAKKPCLAISRLLYSKICLLSDHDGWIVRQTYS